MTLKKQLENNENIKQVICGLGNQSNNIGFTV